MMIQLRSSGASQFENHTTSISAVVQQIKLMVLLSVYDSGNEGSVADLN